MAPNFVEELIFLARYPSMLSVSIAKAIAVQRKRELSAKNKKAKGSLKKDSIFGILIIVIHLIDEGIVTKRAITNHRLYKYPIGKPP